MIDLIEHRRDELNELCRHFRVKSLEVFGSAATNSWNAASSDLDFIVDFLPLPPATHSNSYFGLWFALQDLFDRPIDLVELPAIRNPYFLKRVDKDRHLLYAA